MLIEETKPKRRKRWDAGTMKLTERDLFALVWIGQQYAIRLDHLQKLLGSSGAGEEVLSQDGTRKVVARWMKAGLVEAQRLRGRDPLWVWPTRWGLRNACLPYQYRNMEYSLDDLRHLYAINEIRLHMYDEEAAWVSERELLHEVVWERGRDLLHRPDGEITFGDAAVIAIEAELSQKRAVDLSENLMELVRGEGYVSLKAEHGAAKAKDLSYGMGSRYSDIWYFGEEKVRRSVLNARAQLVENGDLSQDEAKRIYVKHYLFTGRFLTERA